MGYGHYVLPDGREAGYLVEAECEHPDCSTITDRGLESLCGRSPDGHRKDDEPGCGLFLCGAHHAPETHACVNPPCGVWSADGYSRCGERATHNLPHRDPDTGETFTETEDEVFVREAAETGPVS